ncbi:hypothetical protein RMB13_06970 [Acinetobacter sp. V102_4]|uniref:hypothetical protein n=1 Tax=Acinetobacter sp. V102_4 TaxID=3072984 RepID=UPI00287E1D94|nr:hypothetical protein [Acinetobacter sp. V102_4]MDS7929219.1 hypothetical protein [Acinetobacter sp. V102_4]
MAGIVTIQQLKNASVDAEKLEHILNDAEWVEIETRLGRKVYSIATINALISKLNLDVGQAIEDLQAAIEIALEAGAGANGWTADLISYNGSTQSNFNDDVNRKFSNTIIIDNSVSDISSILNSAPENTLVQIRNGQYTGSGIQIEKSNFKIEMQDGVVLTLKAGSNGIFLRFGKRGADTDTNADNLPQHNGTIDYWDENEFSPSTPTFIRHENLGITGGTIVIDNTNGVGGNTGIDFYRCNSPVLETKIKWSSKFNFGNAVRVWFCKDLQSNYLKIDDNENSTFTMLYYWSYGLRAGDWDIGKGVDTSMEFKHSVDGYVRTLKARGSDGVCKAVNFGYGSINNTIDRLEVRGGSVRLKASEEFDLTRGIVINDLDIENISAEGLIIMHVSGLRIGKFRIRAKVPLYFSATPFYMFSSTRGITPSQSTGEYTFDGNYRTSEVSGSITKYFEKRAYPVLQNASFGQGELIATATATQVIFSNVSGGVVDMMTSTGKLRRYEEGQITARGYNENWRASFKYEYSAPNAIEDVDFGDMTIKAENNAANISSMVQFTSPLIKCRGTLRTYADKKSLQFIWMFDSNINLNTNRYLTASAGFVVEMDSMVRSTIGGKLLANGRVVNFKGGSPIYYTDGYVDHKLTGRIIRSSAPISTPPLYTNFSSSSNTWKPLFISGLNIYAEDGTSVAADASIIRHNGSIPAGVSTANGAGYICDQACVTDHNQRFRRIFTDASAETPPPLTPNFIGELAVNTTTNTWWNANSSTTWSKL